MTFGYSTNAYTRFDLLTALEMIAEIGFSGVEIMCDQPHLYPPEWHEQEILRLKDTLCAAEAESNKSQLIHALCGRRRYPALVD